MADPIRRKLELSVDTYTKDKIPYDYIMISFRTTFDVLGTYDKVIMEKIITDPGTQIAKTMFEGNQPMYYIGNNIFASSLNYMGGPEGEYSLEIIDITQNVKQGARDLFDFDIDELSTKVYGYRIRYYESDDDSGSEFTEYATDFNAIHLSLQVNTFSDSLSEDYRPCITHRNIAFRGRNNSTKYNYTLRETESDIIKLNEKEEDIQNDIDDIRLFPYGDVDAEMIIDGAGLTYYDSVLENNIIYIFPDLSILYDMTDKVDIITRSS